MSGVVKGIKKVFKKVGKILKKIIKPLAIAVAVYFTAGLALSAFAPTAGFAASMPGFAGGGIMGTGIGAGATAGTGVFSQAATALGVGGGIQTAAAEIAAAQMAGQAAAAGSALTAGGASTVGSTTASVFNSAAQNAAITAAGSGPATVGSVMSSIGGGIKSTVSGIKAMSLTDKLLLTKVGADVGGALFGPSEQEIAELEAIESKKFRGAYYGMDAAGNVTPSSVATEPPRVEPQQVAQQDQVLPASPEQNRLDEGREKKNSLFPTAQSVPQTAMVTGPGTMKQQIQIPSNISSPAADVRYANG